MSSNNNTRTGNGRVPVIGPSVVYPVPIALSAAAWKGGIVAGEDGNFYGSNGTVWSMAVTVSEVILTTEPPALITVGATGDYPTLWEAFAFLSRYVGTVKEYSAPPRVARTEVRILSGTVMEDPLVIDGLDLGWVDITSEDVDVTVVESACQRWAFGIATDPYFAFMQFRSAYAPSIRTHFVFSYAGWVGALGASGERFTGVFSGDAYLTMPFEAVPTRKGFSGFSNGIYCGGGRCVLFQPYFRDCKTANVTGGGGAYLYVRYPDLRNSTTGSNITVAQQSSANLVGGDFRKVAGADNTGASTSDIQVSGFSTVFEGGADGGTFCGYNVPENRFTPAGVVITSAFSTVPEVSGGILQPTSYTVATLPSAAAYNRHLIHVSNGNGGSPCLAVSDGTSWLRIVPGAAVSA